MSAPGPDDAFGAGTDDAGLTALLWARTLLDGLASAGVREIQIAPGSRSTPLVLAAASHPDLRLRAHWDERSAGFFALGVAKGGGGPSAVITTSGTAVANLLPAVVEASQAEVPLILLTADRPERLRGTDANQSIVQPGIFGRYPRLERELPLPSRDREALDRLRELAEETIRACWGPPAGPVHLNVPFDKPLQPDRSEWLRIREALERRGVSGSDAPRNGGLPRPPGPAPDPAEVQRFGTVARGGLGLIVLGATPDPERVGPAARRLAEALGAPLLADPISGGRFGRDRASAVAGYDLILRSPGARESLRPGWVLRIGRAPTSGTLLRALEEWGVAEHWIVDAGGRWRDHLGVATREVRSDPVAWMAALAAAGPFPRRDDWVERWCRLDRVVAEAAAASLADHPECEGGVAAELVRSLPGGATLFLSNSMPIREVDAFGLWRAAEEADPVRMLGNRGASGIDGVVSTALGASAGAASGSARAGAGVVAFLGDLAMLHDGNGLAAAAGLPATSARPEVVFVVVNNDGGAIFHHLPIEGFAPDFEPWFTTPHGRDLRHLAALHGVAYRTVGPEAAAVGPAVREALEEGGSWILEIGTDRDAAARGRRAVVRAVTTAVDAALEGAGAASPEDEYETE